MSEKCKLVIKDAIGDASSAIEELQKASSMGYSAVFKGHVSNAAELLEEAANKLRIMERGR